MCMRDQYENMAPNKYHIDMHLSTKNAMSKTIKKVRFMDIQIIDEVSQLMTSEHPFLFSSARQHSNQTRT